VTPLKDKDLLPPPLLSLYPLKLQHILGRFCRTPDKPLSKTKLWDLISVSRFCQNRLADLRQTLPPDGSWYLQTFRITLGTAYQTVSLAHSMNPYA